MKRVRAGYTRQNELRKARHERKHSQAEAPVVRKSKHREKETINERYGREQERKQRGEDKFAVYLVVRDMVAAGWNELLALRTIYKNYKAKKGKRFEPGFPMESFGSFLNAFKRFQRKENKTMVKR